MNGQGARAVGAVLVWAAIVSGCESTPAGGTPMGSTDASTGLDVAAQDARSDATTDRGAETGVDAGMGVDVGADGSRDAGADATSIQDVSPDAPADVQADVARDVSAPDGGYRVGNPLPERPAVRGTSMEAVVSTIVHDCPEGQVAVGMAVLVEGRGYAEDVRLECAALDGSGTGFDAPRWFSGDPGSEFNQGRCPAGQHLVGLRGAGGDIIDRLGGECAPLGWGAGATRMPLGPWGGMLMEQEQPQVCPVGAALSGVEVQQVNYFGATTAVRVEGRCRTISAR